MLWRCTLQQCRLTLHVVVVCPELPAPNSKFTWPTWDPTARVNIVLQDTFATENSVDLCTFWDDQGYHY